MLMPKLHQEPSADLHGSPQDFVSRPASTDVAPGKAPGVSSQVPGSGAAQAGDDKATFGFWSSKENKYHAVKLGSRAEAFALAAKNGWEFDCEIPEGWK